MIVVARGVLSVLELSRLEEQLASARFTDGTVSARGAAKAVKHALQLDRAEDAQREPGELVARALLRHPVVLARDGLTYDPVHDAFYGGLLPAGPDELRITFKRPGAGATNDTVIQALVTPIPQPCAYNPPFIGVDAAGNSIFGQRDTAQKLRGCALSPTGELALPNLPFDWSAQDGTFPTWGVLVPEEALYMLDIGAQDNTIFSVGRYPLTQ